MVRVVFVCLGNICRSPMAEAVFAKQVADAGLSEQFSVDSAGTGDWHAGSRPHQGTRRILAEREIPCDHCARVLTDADLVEADYVVAMDCENLRDIRAMGPAKAKVALLLDYAPDAATREVPDPYYTGRFEEVYDLIELGCRGLLQAIRREQGL